jgi:hypothetical protein
MDERQTEVSFPQGVKATVYALGLDGIFKRETVFFLFEMDEHKASIRCKDRGAKAAWWIERRRDWNQFILVVEGWGHPDPPRFVPTAPADYPAQDSRHPAFVAQFREQVIAGSQKTGRKPIVDVHEAYTGQTTNRSWRS